MLNNEIDDYSPVDDLIASLSNQSSTFKSDEEFDFHTGILNADRLVEFGLEGNNLNYIRNGVPVKFKAGFKPERIRPKPNSRSVSHNKAIVSKVVSGLVAPGHVFPVKEKLIVLPPLHVTPKANGRPIIIHNLHRFNRGRGLRGSAIAQPKLFELSRHWNQNMWFCKLDLSHGYYHLCLAHDVGLILGLLLAMSIFAGIFWCLTKAQHQLFLEVFFWRRQSSFRAEGANYKEIR